MKRLIGLLMLGAASAAVAQDAAAPPAPPTAVDYGSESWVYMSPDAHLAKYNSVLIKPSVVFQDPGAQFDGIDPGELQVYADIITGALTTEMPQSFKVVQQTGPRTLAMQVTILGAKKTVGGLATATHILPFGLAANAFKSSQGKGGTFTGSLLLKVEFTDSRTGDLVAAAVRRRAPDALNVGATLSMTDTVKSIAADLAKTLREKMVEAGVPTQSTM
jgi:hypothetical protein